MAELYGWVGKILVVDLSSGDISTLPTSDYVPQFIGGRALAAKLYWDEVPPDCGALDPENSLIFATGPAGGTLGAGSRTTIVAKSPYATPECYMYSCTGGHWCADLKFAGFDAVVVTGKAAEPCYIWIHDGEVEIKKAERLWGLTTTETDTEIRRLWGDKTRCMLIGPAGENLVKSASIIADVSHATGLGGFGAVMGSKNLKAIAVRGTGGVKVARPEALLDFYDEYVKIGGKYGGPYLIGSPAYSPHHYVSNIEKWGPPEIQMEYCEDIDTTFNEDAQWSKSRLDTEEVRAGTIKRKFEGCFACPACCGMAIQCVDPTGNEAAPEDLNPPTTIFQQCVEAHTIKDWGFEAFGGKLDGRNVHLFHATVADLGIQAYPMLSGQSLFNAAVSQGLLTEDNTGLPCGDIAAYNTSAMLGKDGYAYGITYGTNDFFKRLAEGPERFLASMAKESAAWKEIYDSSIGLPYYHMNSGAGQQSSQYMIYKATGYRYHPNESIYHAGGLPSSPLGGKQLCGFAPQAELVDYAIANREKWAGLLGPKWHDLVAAGETQTLEGKATSAIFFQNMQIEADSMPYCGWMGFPRFFSIWTPDHLGDPSVGAKMLAAVCGIDRTMEENVAAMEAPATLERAIHVREGRRREHDVYTDYVFEKTVWTTKDEFNKALDDHYTARGWDVDTGIPTRTQLVKLGLTDVADDLESKYGVSVPA